MESKVLIFEDPEDFLQVMEELQEAYLESHDSTSANGVEKDVK